MYPKTFVKDIIDCINAPGESSYYDCLKIKAHLASHKRFPKHLQYFFLPNIIEIQDQLFY